MQSWQKDVKSGLDPFIDRYLQPGSMKEQYLPPEGVWVKPGHLGLNPLTNKSILEASEWLL